MKGFKAVVDTTKGFLGRVLVTGQNDQEVVLKHPFLLRVRCWLAMYRIVRRQKKLARFNKAHN